MAVGGILATQLNPVAPHPYTLTIDGVDVIRNPATGGNQFGIDPADVTVTEVGPGGVSNMTFKISDPQGTLTVAEGAAVSFWDNTLNQPIFTGWLDTVDAPAGYGDQGKDITISCVGVEAVLDWMTLAADLTLSTATINGGISAIIAACNGIGVSLRAFASLPFGTSSQANPVQIFDYGSNPPDAPVTISAGTTLREALRIWLSMSFGINVAGQLLPDIPNAKVTVDFWYGLRIWGHNILSEPIVPSDYVALDVRQLGGGGTIVENLSWGFEGAQVRQVTVRGTGVVSTFTDGSGRVGSSAVIVDPNITTATAAQAAARAYLAQFATNVRGTYRIRDFSPTANVFAASLTTISNVALNLTAGANIYPISEIAKTWNNSGRQNWTVTYGAPRKSIVRLLRRWTRGTLS